MAAGASWGLTDDSAVTGTCCSCGGPDLVPSTHMSAHGYPCLQFQGALMPSPALCGYCMYMVHLSTHAGTCLRL